MSKVPYTVDVDEYICSALEQIRKMNETRDYSSLMAVVERIQFHAQRMEDAIYVALDNKFWIKQNTHSTDMDDQEFRKQMQQRFKKENEND